MPLKEFGSHAQRDCENDNEKAKLHHMIEDHRKLLYPGCKQGHKKLGTTLEMLQWKAKYGVSDKAFEGMLKIVEDKLPENNELPSTIYEAKQTVCPLGWRFRRSMPALMIASYIKAQNTKILKLVLCAKRYVIRFGEMMILVLPRGHLPR
jgi:transposase